MERKVRGKEKLDIRDNNIRNCPSDCDISYPVLDKLYLDDNELTKFPLIYAPNVTLLSIKNNLITDIGVSSMETWLRVVQLHLSGNPLTCIPDLSSMTQLSTLTVTGSSYVCDCQISWMKGVRIPVHKILIS